MRLPWYQIDADGMTRGEMLGRLLAIGPDAGIGMALRLWRWALEMSPDGDFGGGNHDQRAIAAALGWDPNDALRLMLELAVVGLVERIANAGPVPVGAGFARIRGLERYRRAWEKNQRRKPALLVPVTGTNPAETRPEPARKTETETESKEDLAGKKPPAAPRPPKEPKPLASSRLLTDAMAADFATVRGSKYLFNSERDGPAVAALRKDYPDPEILKRWGVGIRAPPDVWQHISSIAQLRSKWNDLTISVQAHAAEPTLRML